MIQNSSTDLMMRAPEQLSMEELEAIGEKFVKKQNMQQKNILASVSYHWPNGVLYYTIDAAFDSTERATIAAGMKMVEDNSCIRFVARTNENDYVDIIPGGGGCYAQVPYRTGRGRMEIGLQRNGCVYEKVVVHELLHSLGFMHEMNRPDRDTYITINWSNIVNSGAAQFYKDEWVGTTPTLPECDDSGNSDGTDYSGCYSGWFTDACQLGYDYTSIMHYGLTSFAIDSSQWVMTPVDTSVTFTGNSVLSALDIAKMECLYYCDGTNPGTCGGHKYGDSGVIESSGLSRGGGCKWLLRVDDGYGIKLSIESFSIACASGSLMVYDGPDDSGTGTNYCDSSVPSLIQSADSSLYIVYTSTDAGNSFKGAWEKVEIICCDSVQLTSTKSDFTDSAYQSLLMGTWTKESNEINDRPIYKKGSYYLAVKTVSTGFIPSWVATSTPGSGSGFMFGGSRAPKCPHAVSVWTYFSQNSGNIEDDDSLKVTCGAQCTGAVPTTPTGATVDHDGSNTAGSIITYTCAGGNKVYAMCGNDGQWNPTAVSCDSSVTAGPVTTAGPATTTQAPACTWKLLKNKTLKGAKKMGRPKKSKSAGACLNMCKKKNGCAGIIFKKRKCAMFKSYKKIAKQKKTTAGACV